MAEYNKVKVPASGEKVKIENGKLVVPNEPIIPFIEGDGIGPDIWKATRAVLDASVEKSYGGKKKIQWMEIYAGEKSLEVYGANEWLPEESITAVDEFKVAIKGPLTTPVGGGIRSINVALRQKLDLYACVRPVRYFDDVPSPVKNPHRVNMVVFRENTEDVYAGLELEAGTDKVKTLLSYLEESFGWHIRPDSGVGIKPISRTGSRRLIRAAIDFAISRKRQSVTLVHKGNIQKFTEGAFRRWGYELAREEYPDLTVPWDQVKESSGDNRIIIQDVIADNFFQQAL